MEIGSQFYNYTVLQYKGPKSKINLKEKQIESSNNISLAELS